jgi:hypothetical protein
MITAKTAERQRLEQEDMARAIRAYTGPVTKCPPGKAEAKRGWMPEARRGPDTGKGGYDKPQ